MGCLGIWVLWLWWWWGLIRVGAQEGGKGGRELGLRKDPRERLERCGKGGDVK